MGGLIDSAAAPAAPAPPARGVAGLPPIGQGEDDDPPAACPPQTKVWVGDAPEPPPPPPLPRTPRTGELGAERLAERS